MSPNQRREVGDIGIVAACALSRDLAKGFLHINGVPIGDGVQGEAEGSELLFLDFGFRHVRRDGRAVRDGGAIPGD